jgi:hypothetical protein
MGDVPGSRRLDGCVQLEYNPADEHQLHTLREPFPAGGKGFIPSEDRMAAYSLALDLGVSDAAATTFPDPTAPLETRLDALYRHVNPRGGWPGPMLSAPAHLVTFGWLDSAGRIRRRLLTNGGTSGEFRADVERVLNGKMAGAGTSFVRTAFNGVDEGSETGADNDATYRFWFI